MKRWMYSKPICVLYATIKPRRLQSLHWLMFIGTYMYQWTQLSLVQIMACHLFGTMPLSELAGILLSGELLTNFNEIWIKIQQFSLKKMHLKMQSAQWRPFCLILNLLTLVAKICLTHFFCQSNQSKFIFDKIVIACLIKQQHWQHR